MSADKGITAPGPGWRPPGKIKPKFKDALPSLLNSMGEAVARANQMDFGREGIHTQHGFFSANPEQAQSSQVQVIKLIDALLPGTEDIPGRANGYLMQESSNDRMAATTESVSIVNYSTSIYGPIGGIVLALPLGNGKMVAIASGG